MLGIVANVRAKSEIHGGYGSRLATALPFMGGKMARRGNEGSA